MTKKILVSRSCDGDDEGSGDIMMHIKCNNYEYEIENGNINDMDSDDKESFKNPCRILKLNKKESDEFISVFDTIFLIEKIWILCKYYEIFSSAYDV